MDIYLKDKNVTLHTAKKYCEEDINVNIECDKLSAIPSAEEQTYNGIFDEVNIDPIPEEYIIPKGTINIRENGNVDVSKYTNANVNVIPVVEAVKSKGIDFIDYDGTLLYSYTVEEAQQLTELPELPTQKGLICQGWNWSLEDIKEHNRELVVGATYITDDGKTRLYIHIETGERMDVPLCFRQTVANGIEVDWGDGSPVETFTGSGSTDILPIHRYSDIGDYIITLNPLENCILSFGSNSSTYSIMGRNNNDNRIYQNMLRKVEIGNNVTNIHMYAFNNYGSLSRVTIPTNITLIGGNAFSQCLSLSWVVIPNSVTNINGSAFRQCYTLSSVAIPNGIRSISSNLFDSCYSLSTITLPNSVTSIGADAFNACRKLSSIILPNSVTSIGAEAFSGCTILSSINIPNGVTNIQNSTFSGCTILSSINIPNSVTSIGTSAFSSCYSMMIYDFSTHTQIPSLANSNAFASIPSYCKIIVPDELYDEWIIATNWTSRANYIVKKSEVA